MNPDYDSIVVGGGPTVWVPISTSEHVGRSRAPVGHGRESWSWDGVASGVRQQVTVDVDRGRQCGVPQGLGRHRQRHLRTDGNEAKYEDGNGYNRWMYG
ncbi:hypothetical protein [Streptantibioticus ferralitis]|uniref:Uncharacterized protein n=1 Tax=Streptantibioticus ferralitis TaxID=236510 RepID=A0ABT5ZBM3_9ACTN|nr:hypothetical protein [Streptantibioticus ferralitis]MDF2260430.1 hypothetical protein [Streptantibioticus ferralitis]